MSFEKWEKRINAIQNFLLWTVLGIIIICVIALLSFDSLAGAGVGYYMTRQNILAAITISLATTGLLTAVAFLAFMVNKKGYKTVGVSLLYLSIGFLLIDIYMDSLGADILHYGVPVIVKALPANEKGLHLVYRILIGGLSAVGEPLAFAIILGFPELKGFLKELIGMPYNSYSTSTLQKPSPQTRYNATSSVMSNIPKKTSMQLRQPDQPPSHDKRLMAEAGEKLDEALSFFLEPEKESKLLEEAAKLYEQAGSTSDAENVRSMISGV